MFITLRNSKILSKKDALQVPVNYSLCLILARKELIGAMSWVRRGTRICRALMNDFPGVQAAPSECKLLVMPRRKFKRRIAVLHMPDIAMRTSLRYLPNAHSGLNESDL